MQPCNSNLLKPPPSLWTLLPCARPGGLPCRKRNRSTEETVLVLQQTGVREAKMMRFAPSIRCLLQCCELSFALMMDAAEFPSFGCVSTKTCTFSREGTPFSDHNTNSFTMDARHELHRLRTTCTTCNRTAPARLHHVCWPIERAINPNATVQSILSQYAFVPRLKS
jgi:hypothetical protein